MTISTEATKPVDFGSILQSEGPVIDAVLLRATGETEAIRLDTTPKKQEVSKILGGPFTFLGQYEDEGIILMVRREGQSLEKNQHKLQPPFCDMTVRGDILALKVADEEHADASNEEFFLSYTKEEYLKFAARTDFVGVTPTKIEELHVEDVDLEDEYDDEEEDDSSYEGEEDESDEDNAEELMGMLMEQVLKRFQQDNGRVPEDHEIEAIQRAITEKLGLTE